MVYHTIDQLNLHNQRVLIRVGFNVPLDQEGKVSDDTRIRQAIPTIRYARGEGAKVILASHLGRPKGRTDSLSLKPVAQSLSELLKAPVTLASDCVGRDVEDRVNRLVAGDVLLLENLRFHQEEEENEAKFSKALASLADVYINEAFSVSHRSHASIVGLPNHVSVKGIGFVMKNEIEALGPLLEQPEKPVAVILGGAKVKSKIGLIQGLLPRVDMIIVGGAMAYTVQYAYGISVGKSPVEKELLQEVKVHCDKAMQQGVTLLLPKDHVVASERKENIATSTTSNQAIPQDQVGLDIGLQTIETFQRKLRKARTVFWNGPLGVCEIPPFGRGTKAIAETVIEHAGHSVIGGGDTVKSLSDLGLADRFSYCSTGGGASLTFLTDEDLPGLKAVRET